MVGLTLDFVWPIIDAKPLLLRMRKYLDMRSVECVARRRGGRCV